MMDAPGKTKMSNKPTKPSKIASKIPTSDRDSGTHSRSSSVSNLTSVSDIHSEIGDPSSDSIDDFKIDEKVFVNGTKPGQIKFLGKTEFAPGVWAGVLLDEPVGKNDGSVAGVKYFTCKPQHGIFARANKLTKTQGTSSPATGDSGLVGFVTPKKSSAIPSSRASVCSSVSASSTRTCSRLRVGELITVSSLGGEKPGTLKFIGETDFAKGEWAGIELDEPTGKNDGSVAGKRYFTCQMKYGLFAPMHKISRAGGTPLSRTARGTPLIRSNSRDSLSSSVSNCSRASRVKLGVTSLSSAQKMKVSASGGGITTATKALQEALKEKEQHIDQLLKERDLDRTEFARISSHFEELQNKSSELEEKNKKTELDRKALEDQLSTVQKKLEDIQFQLEEEKINKSDFEVQFQQRSEILKRIEEYVLKETGDKYLNIKEILSGKENLSELGSSTEAAELNKKLVELESSVKQLCEEKEELLNKLNEIKKASSESLKENEISMHNLETAVQEKEDIIINLKSELNKNIEKVTQLIEDNKHLSEQILFKEEEAKGHADEVITELGERVISLNQEVQSKSRELNEHIASIQEKDQKILALEQNLNNQVESLKQLQNELDSVKEILKHKEADLEERDAAQKMLEDSISALKSQLESSCEENQKKIDLLDQDIKTKTDLVNQYLVSVQEKESLTTTLEQNFDAQAAILSQLQNEHQETLEILKKKDEEITEHVSKQKTLEDLQSLSENSNTVKEEKILNLVKEIESLTNIVQAKDDELAKSHGKLQESQISIEKLNETLQQLAEKVRAEERSAADANNISAAKIIALQDELKSVEAEKVRRLTNAEVEIHSLKEDLKLKEDMLQTIINVSGQHEKEISNLTETLNKNEEELNSLKSEMAILEEQKQTLLNEKQSLEISLKAKGEEIADFRSQVDSLQTSLNKSTADLEKKDTDLQTIQDNLNAKDDEIKLLASKLELAEQKVDMLNKDSSDHVMSLQKELSKLKEETTSTISYLEQELNKLKIEKSKLGDTISEREDFIKEKESKISSLENSLKDKETEVLNLNVKMSEIQEELEKQKADFHAEQEKLLAVHFQTENEFKQKLLEKEKEIYDITEQVKKLSNDLKEQELTNSQLQEIVNSLESTLQEKTDLLENSFNDNEIAIKDFTQKALEFESKEKDLQEKLSNLTNAHDDILKQKELVIQDIQNQLSHQSEQLTCKIKDLEDKEKEMLALKNIIVEKETQFIELSKMVEITQSQLQNLLEQNKKNEELLLSKESAMKDIVFEHEKQCQLKEQAFEEDITKLQVVIQEKEKEMKLQENVISTLKAELVDQKKVIESLHAQLETVLSENNELAKDANSAYEQLKKQIKEMEVKYTKLLEEKEKIAKEELKIQEEKQNLESDYHSLLQQKSAQDEVVKDRETKLAALQAEVNRMQTEFTQHKKDFQDKLNVSQMEQEAVKEFKKELDVQHKVCEELQEELQANEKKVKALEIQLEAIPKLTDEKNKLQALVDEFEKVNDNASEIIERLEAKNLTLEEELNNHKNSVLLKEKEILNLKEQLQKIYDEKISSLNSSLKSLEEENNSLKAKITLLELFKSETKSDISTKSASNDLSAEDAEEKESLLSQIDFLNSIIVDMKQKNEELTRKLEIQMTCWDEPDINLNDSKAIAPRLFCDICDMFDLHDTEDCPKQESFMEEEVPQLKRPGNRQLEERPYCNNCEVFGHWTLDCKEEETF